MHYSNYQLVLAILVASSLSACGPKSTAGVDPSMQLPNKMVPVNVTVDNDGVLNETSEDTQNEPLVISHAVNSDGIDDELEAENPPSTNAPDTFTLAASGQTLGEMPQADYLVKQVEWVGSDYPACNFFLITALCESGYCTRQKPFYKAADFDDYFTRENWKQIKLEDLRIKSIANQTMDVVFQKEGVTADKPGHVLVLVGYNLRTRRFIIAEGSLGTITNAVKEVSDNFLLNWNGGFKIFVRQPAPAPVLETVDNNP